MASSVYLVFQRYRSCKLLLHETEWIKIPLASCDDDNHCGLLVYVSFSSVATIESIGKTAQHILQLPLMTRGQWGDDSRPASFCTLLQESLQSEQTVSLVLVPQANLISKVKGQGKSFQYHGQMEKKKCEAFFETLVNQIRSEILTEQCQVRQEELPEWLVTFKKTLDQESSSADQQVTPWTPPSEIFRVSGKYSTFNDIGLPMTDAQGEPLTKSAQKRVRKLYDAQLRRFEKWKEKHGADTEPPEHARTKNVTPTPEDLDKLFDDAIDKTKCQVVAGSFGMRQGLEMNSDLGPFCHTVQL